MTSVNSPQSVPTDVIDGTHFAKPELLSLCEDFAHDVRTPLTVISEFSAMLEEGVLEDSDERRDAAAIINEKAAETHLLVDVLEMLVGANCGSIEYCHKVCEDRRVLEAAITQLEQFRSFRQTREESPGDAPSERVRCDPSLAAMALVHMGIWMRRATPRNIDIRLERRPAAALAGVVFLAARQGCVIDDATIVKASATDEAGDGVQRRPMRKGLPLRVAFELGKLAGGDVFFVGDQDALALLLPSARTHDTEP